MWLENDGCEVVLRYSFKVSILLLMDVAGKPRTAIIAATAPPGFNPSSNGCGWKTPGMCLPSSSVISVSILLLMDVAGKLIWKMWPVLTLRSFNPSSNGCGWKTADELRSLAGNTAFQSFF